MKLNIGPYFSSILILLNVSNVKSGWEENCDSHEKVMWEEAITVYGTSRLTLVCLFKEGSHPEFYTEEEISGLLC